MIDIVLLSALLNLAYAVGAFLLLIIALRYLDRRCGFNFREWLNETSDMAKSLYLGARIIAGAIVLAGIISIPV